MGVAATLAATALLNHVLAKRAEHHNPPIGRFITVNGVRLHYLERGTGMPLVLLHGNGTIIQDFLSSGLIDEAAKHYRVIAFDRPGFGHSQRPRTTVWTPEAQANLISAALDEIGISRAIVVGHSWGTLVALALAHNYPQKVQSLVLASGFYYPNVRGDVLLLSPPGRPGARRYFALHPFATHKPAHVAASSSQAVWPEPGAEEVRRFSRRDGGATTITAPRGRCEIGTYNSHPRMPFKKRTSNLPCQSPSSQVTKTV